MNWIIEGESLHHTPNPEIIILVVGIVVVQVDLIIVPVTDREFIDPNNPVPCQSQPASVNIYFRLKREGFHVISRNQLFFNL